MVGVVGGGVVGGGRRGVTFRMWEFQICLGMRTRMVFAQRLVEVTMPIGISLSFFLYFFFSFLVCDGLV